MKYYRRYMGKFQLATRRLTLAQVGAYDRLLDDYYATGKPLPDDLPVLYGLCCATSADDQAAVRMILDQFFPRYAIDGLRHNPTADKELAFSLQAVEYGKKGGRPVTEGKTISETSSETLLATSFLSFWAAYPRKVGRAAAVKAWRRLAPDEALQKMLRNALDAQKASPQWLDKQYIPHASTWLNGRRWEDEIADSRPVKAGRTTVTDANTAAARAFVEQTAKPALESVQITAVSVGVNGDWRKTQQGIEAKGRELGMMAQGMETYEQWALRLVLEIERRRLLAENKRLLEPKPASG